VSIIPLLCSGLPATTPRGSVSERIDGKNAPLGSLYKPMLMSVIGWTMHRPFSKHQQNSSPLRVGRRNPGTANAGAAPRSALRSSLVSPTAWANHAIAVA